MRSVAFSGSDVVCIQPGAIWLGDATALRQQYYRTQTTYIFSRHSDEPRAN
jgi:hypothetical protein